MTDKGTNFNDEVVKATREQVGISLKHAGIKHAQTIALIGQTHQKLMTILKIKISANQPQWDEYVNIAAAMAHNTTYQASLKMHRQKCSTKEHHAVHSTANL